MPERLEAGGEEERIVNMDEGGIHPSWQPWWQTVGAVGQGSGCAGCLPWRRQPRALIALAAKKKRKQTMGP